jgi:hypothetical protein
MAAAPYRANIFSTSAVFRKPVTRLNRDTLVLSLGPALAAAQSKTRRH